jgi:drug/metabolite transporter (DMT)-like permease
VTLVSAAPAGRSAALLGVTLMLAGMLLFALNDVMGKWLVATYTVGQVLLLRSAAALAVLGPALAKRPMREVIAPRRFGLHVLRVAVSTLEVALFYWAVIYLPLADAMTYWLAGPIYVALLSASLLKEHVSPARWALVGLGFVGVVVALQPTSASFGLPALLCVVGSLAYAVMVLLARVLRETPDVTLVAWQNAGALAAGLVLAPIGWVAPSLADAALLALLGVVAMGAHLLVTRALKLAPASIVAPYQYTLIVWAALFGFIAFGDVPGSAILVGAAIITTAGLGLMVLDARPAEPEPERPCKARGGRVPSARLDADGAPQETERA